MDLRQAYARDPKQVVLDLAGENLHDIFMDPLELNSVETEVTAAESLWQAGKSKWASIQDGFQEDVGVNTAERQKRV